MSDEPTERDVLTTAERNALHWSVHRLIDLYRLGEMGSDRFDHEWASVVERILAERAVEAHGTCFRVEVACDGYASLTAADVPDEVFDEDDYYLGAQHAAEGIRAALRGDTR